MMFEQGDMQFFIDEHLFALPSDLRPGVYDLQIALYDLANGVRLPITDLDGNALNLVKPLGFRIDESFWFEMYARW